MRAGERQRGKEEIGDPLLAIKVAIHVDEVVAAIAGRRYFEKLRPLRCIAQDAARIGETHVEQLSPAKVKLVADCAHVESLPVLGSRLKRIQEAKSVMRVVAEVIKKARAQNVSGREIHLETSHITRAKSLGPVTAGREL